MQWIIFLGASREITVAHSLRRQFFWYNNITWLEDVPAHIGVVVGVSGADKVLISAPAVVEYVEKCEKERRGANRRWKLRFWCYSTSGTHSDLFS
jgi:hypothetical protein